MANPKRLEEIFQLLLKDLDKNLPDGILDVNLELLQSLGLATIDSFAEERSFFKNNEQFYMVDNEEKLTLFNDQFVIWMLPSFHDACGITHVFIAKNKEDDIPKLELVFHAKGVYNTSNIVLTVLDAFLQEMKETDSLLLNLIT